MRNAPVGFGVPEIRQFECTVISGKGLLWPLPNLPQLDFSDLVPISGPNTRGASTSGVIGFLTGPRLDLADALLFTRGPLNPGSTALLRGA